MSDTHESKPGQVINAETIRLLDEILGIIKYNPDQPRDEAGRWGSGGGAPAAGGGEGGGGSAAAGGGGPSTYTNNVGITYTQEVDSAGRPIPIKVDNIDDAVAMVKEGKVVELPDPKSAATLVVRLAEEANRMKAEGKKAKDYDLCNVSVGGTNLFCGSKLRSEEYPNGVPRIEMPQLGGKPVPGSEADRLPRVPWNPAEVDGAAAFTDHLTNKLGIKVANESVAAADLRASQAELIGPKVAGIMLNKKFNPKANPIFISRDNYVIDGHHRWAAVVGRDATDGHLGDSKMPVIRVDAPISEVLHIANKWSSDFGIAQAAGVKKGKKGGCGCGNPIIDGQIIIDETGFYIA